MIARCVHFVKQHKSRPQVDVDEGFSPPSLSMRRFSHKYWQAAKNKMAAGNYLAKPSLRSIYTTWKQLGETLQLESAALVSSGTQQVGLELQVTKRCAWAECLCGAYKPAHGLRLCKGCSAVAYCNSRCQRRFVCAFLKVTIPRLTAARDWESHRAICLQPSA